MSARDELRIAHGRTNWGRIDGWVNEGLEALVALEGYERHLDWARSLDRDKARADRVEEGLLAAACDARKHVASLCRSVLGIYRHAFDIGLYAAVQAFLEERLRDEGPFSITELLDKLVTHPVLVEEAVSRGVPSRVLDRLRSEAQSDEWACESDREGMFIRGKRGSVRVDQPGARRARSLRARLQPGVVRGVYDAIEAGRRPATAVVRMPRRNPDVPPVLDPEEDLGITALELLATADAHVDKLRHHGLDAYRGSDLWGYTKKVGKIGLLPLTWAHAAACEYVLEDDDACVLIWVGTGVAMLVAGGFALLGAAGAAGGAAGAGALVAVVSSNPVSDEEKARMLNNWAAENLAGKDYTYTIDEKGRLVILASDGWAYWVDNQGHINMGKEGDDFGIIVDDPGIPNHR